MPIRLKIITIESSSLTSVLCAVIQICFGPNCSISIITYDEQIPTEDSVLL